MCLCLKEIQYINSTWLTLLLTPPGPWSRRNAAAPGPHSVPSNNLPHPQSGKTSYSICFLQCVPEVKMQADHQRKSGRTSLSRCSLLHVPGKMQADHRKGKWTRQRGDETRRQSRWRWTCVWLSGACAYGQLFRWRPAISFYRGPRQGGQSTIRRAQSCGARQAIKRRQGMENITPNKRDRALVVWKVDTYMVPYNLFFIIL